MRLSGFCFACISEVSSSNAGFCSSRESFVCLGSFGTHLASGSNCRSAADGRDFGGPGSVSAGVFAASYFEGSPCGQGVWVGWAAALATRCGFEPGRPALATRCGSGPDVAVLVLAAPAELGDGARLRPSARASDVAAAVGSATSGQGTAEHWAWALPACGQAADGTSSRSFACPDAPLRVVA